MLHIEGNTNGYNTAPLIYFGTTSTANAAVRDWAIGPADSDYGNFHIFQGASTGAAAVGTSQIAFTIDSNKNVGIRTSIPSSYYSKNLVVLTDGDGTGGITLVSPDTDDAAYICFADGISGAARYAGYLGYSHNATENMFLGVGGSTKMTLRSDGLTAIGGNHNPSAPLDIETPGNTADGTYYSTITINNTGSNTFSRLRFDRSASARWGIGLRNDDKFQIAKLFNTASDDTFVIDSSGKVGVGTDSPGALFNVDVGAPSSSDQTLGLFQSQTSRQIGFVWDDSASTLGVATITNHDLVFHAGGNSSEKMRIDTDGRITQTMTAGTTNYLAYHFKRYQAEANGPRVANYMEMRFTDTAVANGSVNASIRAHSNTWYNSDMEMSFHSATGGTQYEVMRITAARDLSLQNEDTQVIGGFGAKTTAGTTDFNHNSNARSGNGHTLLRMDTATNGGAGGTAYYHVFNYEYASRDADGNMTQIAIGYNDNRQFMRHRYGGTWSSWHEM